jgi:predicted ATPase/DNA-binding winged helix-turn-helix (wHTH) protein
MNWSVSRLDRAVMPPRPGDRLMPKLGNVTQSYDPDAPAYPTIAGTVSFGPFRLHVAQRRIERDGNPVQLPARAFDILVALIAQAGTVVTKNELMATVWPGVTVDESNLRVHIAALRKALGDGEAGARYLSTVSGQGYCFVTEVSHFGDAKPSLLAPAPHQPHNLPARPLKMVGRNHTVDEVMEKLANSRFITIIGPGGIGKTTVAISTGHALLAEFAGQVRFIDLGTIRDPALIPGIVASALGLPARSTDPSVSLVAFLRDKRMLLMLDCCEHVIEASAALAELLHKQAPQLHILATSRERLRVEGEHIYRLEPLASPPQESPVTAASALAFPAVQLFLERAVASGGEFELTNENAPDVAAICRRLDGIALAIELTASRVSAYGVKTMIELLDSQFKLLWEGRRTALPRHRTLRATIDWSYALLSEQERTILGHLSVFSGNFSLEAAWAVAATAAADDATIMAALDSLVAKSMVTVSSHHRSVRYRLLDTTRMYAQEKLASSGDANAAAKRHAAYFVDFLRSVGTKSIDLLKISDQLGNIRSALTWSFSDRGDRATGVALAAASMPFFLEISLFTECRLWATHAIEIADQTNETDRYDLDLHASLGLARLLTEGATEGAAACLVRALGLAEKIADVKLQLHLLELLHTLHSMSGNVAAALNIAKQGEAIAIGCQDRAALARQQLNLSISHHYLGDVPTSRAYIDAAMSDRPEADLDTHGHLDLSYPGRGAITLARILWLQGYPDQAIELARQTLDKAIASEHPTKVWWTLLTAFGVFYWNCEAHNYGPYIDRLLRDARRYDLKFIEAAGGVLRGIVSIAKGEVRAGLLELKSSVAEVNRSRLGPVVDFNVQLAEAMTLANQSDEALGIIDEAIARSEHLSSHKEMPNMLRIKGEVLASMTRPDFAQAERFLDKSRELARCQGALGFELRAAVSLAILWAWQGRREQAIGMLAPIYSRFSEGFETRLLTAARELLNEPGSPHSDSAAQN